MENEDLPPIENRLIPENIIQGDYIFIPKGKDIISTRKDKDKDGIDKYIGYIAGDDMYLTICGYKDFMLYYTDLNEIYQMLVWIVYPLEYLSEGDKICYVPSTYYNRMKKLDKIINI